MRFQQAPYRIADVVALLFILHGNTSFGSLAPIIPYRSCKHYLAMVDYLSREHRLPLYNAYNDMRKQKLADPIYPQSILALAKVMEDDSILSDSLEKAIPEFRSFNIAENEIWNIV